MNKERTLAAKLILDLTKVATRENGMSRRASSAVETCLRALISSEEKALKGMEPYKDNATTAPNYAKARECLDYLNSAVEALLDGEYEEVTELMHLAIDPPVPEPVKPVKKTSRKGVRTASRSR